MSATNADEARQEFVEAAALYFERLGLSRTSGRVLGTLLVSSEGSADAPELCADLAVAKSSMSVALRRLEAGGLVERYRRPRERRDRYRLADDIFGRAFQLKMAEFTTVQELVEQGLSVVGDDPVARRRLRSMADMYAFMAREFPKLLDQWETERQRSQRG